MAHWKAWSKDLILIKSKFLFGVSQGGLISAMVAEECKEKVAGMILLFLHCVLQMTGECFKSEFQKFQKNLNFGE